MSELAGEMRVSKQQLTLLVSKLIDNGFLVKKRDENDRRIVRLEVTELGKSIHHNLHAEIKLSLTEKLGTLSEMELDELEQMLQRIHALLESVTQTGIQSNCQRLQ